MASFLAPRSLRRAAAASVLALLAASSGGACTVFNDLELPKDAGADAGFTPFEPAYLSVDQAARVCRWASECDRLAPSVAMSIGLPLDPDNFSECLHWLAGPLPKNRPGTQVQTEMLAAVAEATSCDDALSRVFFEVLGDADPRCAGTPTPTCLDSKTAVQCKDRRLTRCDSPRFVAGSSCQEIVDKGDPVGACVTGTCSDLALQCEGGVFSACTGGHLIEAPCATIGMTCWGADPGICGPSSSKKPTACLLDQLGASQCAEGERAQICNGVQFVEYWCGAADATCVEEQSTARCVPYTPACSPFDADTNVCDGDHLAVCIGGQKTAVDCAALDLRCAPPEGARTARCATK